MIGTGGRKAGSPNLATKMFFLRATLSRPKCKVRDTSHAVREGSTRMLRECAECVSPNCWFSAEAPTRLSPSAAPGKPAAPSVKVETHRALGTQRIAIQGCPLGRSTEGTGDFRRALRRRWTRVAAASPRPVRSPASSGLGRRNVLAGPPRRHAAKSSCSCETIQAGREPSR